MKKTIGVLAHVDAGKTTFSEQLLYHTKTIHNRGRVDHKDIFLDSHEIEKQRGITIFADQAIFTYQGSTYYLLDTPGHVDFSPEMERAIQVMDYAIVILSAVEGVEGHTETIWQLLQQHNVPTFFFLNKTDREGADINRVMSEIRSNLSDNAVELTSDFRKENMNEMLVEFIAERDEQLLDTYMETGYEPEKWYHALKKLIKRNRIFPCFRGSALKDEGVREFLDIVDHLSDTSYSSKEKFAGQVYKIRHDTNGNRVTFIKAFRGSLRVRDEVSYGGEANQVTEKITHVRVYNGVNHVNVDEVTAGDLFAVLGITKAEIGDSIGETKKKANFEMVPTLRTKVVFDPSISTKEMIDCFQRLDAEDPSLQVIWDEYFQEIHIHVMGVIQLEVLKQIVKKRFNYDVTFQQPEILYKESLTTSVEGYGHFEPLRHHAEVHLRLEPAPRNSGVLFANNCHANDMSIGTQNLVRRHLFERNHNGLLTGSALTDVKITLLTGRAHPKHTSGGDFREATYRALRQGLEKAENILLEPYYDFKIKVDLDDMGKVLTDIQQANGFFETPKTEEEKAIIVGKVPVATFMNYQAELASSTHGKGVISLRFGGYGRCHNEAEVIQRIGYQKGSDPQYSSNSIFCAKGQGFTVPWDQAENYMHCLK
ncbi:small GTP-binding protein domain-containing protein [Oceanobacillus limi]|uniref:Small GTP-binding protein domain-containing protein n=1 Tax=Oceanobacillus limi TaxID=930131 RepID=A0A1I0GAD8_9BACI|nr:TetM/TetW/TetO/TetS family tetracycline resistance ribosomal protection protein [Oceanobacillus limi]SET67753.1 small GTP-binding protein domain-containing protein [Oceanobacillus limi]